MTSWYVRTREGLLRMRRDQRGVVSFEYVIVAACIVGAVAAVFGTDTGAGVGLALSTALGKVTAALGSAA
jgi:pilus assembly protein Flp/PilA